MYTGLSQGVKAMSFIKVFVRCFDVLGQVAYQHQQVFLENPKEPLKLDFARHYLMAVQ